TQLVQVQTGTYDSANGETFALIVPANVQLIGDPSNPATRLIYGGGGGTGSPVYASVSIGQNSVVTGFTITDPQSAGVGVLMAASGGALRKCTLTGNTVWGLVADSVPTGLDIEGNEISNNDGGVLLYASAKLRSNRILYNSNQGIFVGTLGADLNGDAGFPTYAGANAFFCNGFADVVAGVAGTIVAENDYWDHSQPVTAATGSVGGGIDFCSDVGGTVDAAGGAGTIDHCN